jgi:hypothetical protein
MCSCFNNYYSSRAINDPVGPDLQALREPGKKVFIHFKDMVMMAEKPTWKDGILTTTLRDGGTGPNAAESIDKAEGVHVFDMKDREEIESHLHVFSNMSALPSGQIVSIPGRTITGLRKHQYDAGLTLGSQVLGIAGVLALVAILLFLVGLLMFTAVRKSFEPDLNSLTLF